jgi:hypothetical protein
LRFLDAWSQDWTGAQMKAVLSQTALCGAVHMHGTRDNRLLADLDCNGWPQSGRDRALEAIRRAWAVHLCGDQHLAVAVKHGIENWGDGPYAFTSPALVNTIYGRWWQPLDRKPGANAAPSPLPWTGDYKDGLGNKFTMLAYANPPNIRDEQQRGDGYGVVRFDKPAQEITFECWPRFSNVEEGDRAQFKGWPITINTADNDGRKPKAWLPELRFEGFRNPVVQVIEDSSGEVLYTVRARGAAFQPAVYAAGRYTIKIGRDKPVGPVLKGIEAKAKSAAGHRKISNP